MKNPQSYLICTNYISVDRRMTVACSPLIARVLQRLVVSWDDIFVSTNHGAAHEYYPQG